MEVKHHYIMIFFLNVYYAITSVNIVLFHFYSSANFVDVTTRIPILYYNIKMESGHKFKGNTKRFIKIITSLATNG